MIKEKIFQNRPEEMLGFDYLGATYYIPKDKEAELLDLIDAIEKLQACKNSFLRYLLKTVIKE
ncbi:MAG: hypothetical protein NTW16_12885 [Bacteroidetes bacterium]|nr:hypothetical protein [Bacteroidota bacterium]